MECSFFEFRQRKWSPWAFSVDTTGAMCTTSNCGTCGSPLVSYRGPVYAKIEKGTQWPDAVGSGGSGPRFFVSERVVDGLKAVAKTSFRPHPMEIADVTSKRLRELKPPKYFYLELLGRIDIELRASGLCESAPCPECFKSPVIEEATGYVPKPETWDGQALFSIRNYPIAAFFCTEEVLELARKDRWSNFSFQPMDVVRKHSYGWRGVDYLGRKWPPKRWYPDAPSSGKTLKQWLRDLGSQDVKTNYAARLALLDLGAQVIGPVSELLVDSDDRLLRRAAEVLRGIETQGNALPGSTAQRVEELLGPRAGA